MSAPRRLRGSRRAAWWRKLEVTAALEMPPFTATAILNTKDDCDRAGGTGVELWTATVPDLRRHFRVSHGEYILVSCPPVSIIVALLSLGSLSGMPARADALWRITYAATAVVVQQVRW